MVRLSDGTTLRTARPKASFDSQKLRRAFDEIVDLLDQIEKRWRTALAHNEIEIRGDGCPTNSEALLTFMDSKRNEIIRRVNKIYRPLGKHPLPPIRTVAMDERNPGFRITISKEGIEKLKEIINSPIDASFYKHLRYPTLQGGRIFPSDDDPQGGQ